MRENGTLRAVTQPKGGNLLLGKRKDETSAQRFRRLTDARWKVHEREQQPSRGDGKCTQESITQFYQQAIGENYFGISCMAFQDVFTLETERLKRCCVHVITPSKKLIPFCAFYLTDTSGRRLYDNHLPP
jgi:hypothetical protein